MLLAQGENWRVSGVNLSRDRCKRISYLQDRMRHTKDTGAHPDRQEQAPEYIFNTTKYLRSAEEEKVSNMVTAKDNPKLIK